MHLLRSGFHPGAVYYSVIELFTNPPGSVMEKFDWNFANFSINFLTRVDLKLYTSKAGCKSDPTNGILAQLGEHLPYKQRVTGSSPVGPIFTDFDIGIRHMAR